MVNTLRSRIQLFSECMCTHLFIMHSFSVLCLLKFVQSCQEYITVFYKFVYFHLLCIFWKKRFSQSLPVYSRDLRSLHWRNHFMKPAVSRHDCLKLSWCITYLIKNTEREHLKYHTGSKNKMFINVWEKLIFPYSLIDFFLIFLWETWEALKHLFFSPLQQHAVCSPQVRYFFIYLIFLCCNFLLVHTSIPVLLNIFTWWQERTDERMQEVTLYNKMTKGGHTHTYTP